MGLGLASASGLLWAACCSDFRAWPLAWVAMVPALYAVERASTARRAVFFAWWAGLVTNLGGFVWLVGLVERFGQAPRAAAVLVWLLFCSYQALRFALFGWAVRVIRGRRGLPLALLAPVLMVACEMCLPFVFPYYLGISQARQTPVIQIAELTGPLGVTALLMLVNGAVYDAAAGRRRLAPAVAAAAILAAALGFGHLRIRQVSEVRARAPHVKVGVVQPNVASGTPAGVFDALRLAELQRKSAELDAAGADLIVWPESSLPARIPRRAEGDWPETHPLRLRQNFKAPLVVSAVTSDAGRFYNSALMLDREGKFAGRYDKNHLVLLGEYVPGLDAFPQLRELLPPSVGNFAAGAEATTFPFETADGREWRLGPMICLEDILPSFGRRLARLHPHLLVNTTNDSWFGDTAEPHQHLALSVFRSVELRVDLVRATLTGVSAYVDATGRVHAQTYVADPAGKPRRADAALARVALVEGGHTVYAAVGDLFGYLCAAAAVLLLLAGKIFSPPSKR